jgi:hypothetical protein
MKVYRYIPLVLLLSSCANITPEGAKVSYVEVSGNALEVQEVADRIAAKSSCRFLGYLDAKTAMFPGSYSIHDNEIHSALRNRAAKVGANVVVANFYKKPAQGIGLSCPESYFKEP